MLWYWSPAPQFGIFWCCPRPGKCRAMKAAGAIFKEYFAPLLSWNLFQAKKFGSGLQRESRRGSLHLYLLRGQGLVFQWDFREPSNDMVTLSCAGLRVMWHSSNIFSVAFPQLKHSHTAAQSPWGWEQSFSCILNLIPVINTPAGKILSFGGKVGNFFIIPTSFHQ